MEKRTIPIITLAVFSMSVLLSIDFMINPAYAVAGFQSFTPITASAGTNDNCSGITKLPLTGYIVTQCRTPNNNSIRVLQSSGTVIASSTYTNIENNVFDCWSINNLQAVCQTATSNAANGLRRVTVTSISSITTTDFVNPCPVQSYHLSGSSLYGICTGTGVLTSGTIFRVSLSSFTQTGTWTGGAGNYLLPVSDSRMVTVSSATIRLYSINPQSSGSASLLSTGTSISSYSTNNIHVSFAYDGVYLYYGRQDQPLEAISLNLSTNTFGTAIAYSFNVLDIKGISTQSGSSYWLLLGNNNQIYLLKKLSDTPPPNNIVVIQTVTVTYATTLAKLGTADSLNFVISKGASAGVVYFISATNLHNENDNPIFSPKETGGIDCSLAENENILICRLGGDGTLGSAGAFVVGNTTEGTGILGIGCSIGLVDCVSDPNPQTNGLGLLIFIASVFVVVGMFFKSMGAQATFQMPMYIWIVLLLGLSAFFTITGLIDPVFLILTVVGLIALGAPKIAGMIKGGSTFGSGSTE